MTRYAILVSLLFSSMPAFATSAPTHDALEAPKSGANRADDKVDFVKQILPILKNRCFECHSGEDDEGDLLLDDKANVFGGDRDEIAIKPGDPKASELYKRITLPAEDSDVMPSEGDPLSKEQIALVERWIREGATWPDGAVVKTAATKKVVVEVLKLEERSPEAEAAVQAAMKRLRDLGATAMPISAKSNAIYVNLSLLGDKVDDAVVDSALSGLEPALVWLNLGRTKVTDVAALGLTPYTELRRLHLQNTGIGDDALESIAQLPNLEYLNLYGTKVGDAAIAKLSACKKLRKLFVWQTNVSPTAVAALEAKLPGLRIDRGEYVDTLREVTKKLEEARRPVNDICPLKNKKADPTKVFKFKGQNVALCCAKCLAAFKKDPAKYWPKVVYRKGLTKPAGLLDPPAPAPLPALNAKCPITGKAIDVKQQVSLGDASIAFCCEKCKAKFIANLAAHPQAKKRFGPATPDKERGKK